MICGVIFLCMDNCHEDVIFLNCRRKEIGVLHSKFGMEFDSVIRSVIESEIKNSAVPFKVDQCRLQRSMLEKYFHQRLKDRLEGIYIN